MINQTSILRFLTKLSGKPLLLIIHCLVFVLGAYAQNPVSWSLNATKNVKAGAKLDARLSADISGGWYLYSLTQPSGGPNATRITLPSEQAFKLASAIKAPSPKVKFDENFGINTESYAGSVTFTIPLSVSRDAHTGKHMLAVYVRFQACNETTCLPPRSVKVETPVEIALVSTVLANTNANVSPADLSQTASPTPMPKSTPLTTPSPVENSVSAEQQSANSNVIAENTGGEKPEENKFSIKDERGSENNQSLIRNQNLDVNQSLLSFLWLAATVGALLLLTPCVFPMIPITVSYFTNHSAGHRSKAIKLASVYSLGIILTFTLLGMLLAIFVGAAGINLFAANPLVNLLIAGIFLFFALNLFGAYEITVPRRVLTKFDNLTSAKKAKAVASSARF